MIQSLGWAGSALIVGSLMLRRPVPFRIVNLASPVVLLVFDYAIGVWSMVVLNIAILLVNLWQLRDAVCCAGATRPRPRPQIGSAEPTRPSRLLLVTWLIRPRPATADRRREGAACKPSPPARPAMRSVRHPNSRASSDRKGAAGLDHLHRELRVDAGETG